MSDDLFLHLIPIKHMIEVVKVLSKAYALFSMDNQKINNTENTQNDPNIISGKTKVIQPLHSREQIEEDSGSNEDIRFHPPADINKIYQQPAQQNTTPTPPIDAAHASNSPQMSNKAQIINVLIIVVGIYIGGSALLGLLSGVRSLSLGFAGAGDIILVLDVIFLCLAVGIILKKNIARVLYIFLALILLSISIVGTYHYFSSDKINTSNTYNSEITTIEQSINQDENNKSIPLAQREQMVRTEQNALIQLQNQAISEQLALSNQNRKIVVALIEGYALSVIPIVLLIIKPVREQFT